MEWMGLVSRVEEDLERMISLGLLPEDGSLPSENSLARRYGVSRSTVRGALLRLSARGLVVRRQGRRTRAATMDEALTLESLGMALHGEGGQSHPSRRRLLEGYLALKRDTLVELLASCCQQASETDLDRLEEACFALADAAQWQESSRWVELEFALLRLAAGVADRPGHLLLIQSLERAFRGMAAKVLPRLEAKATSQWAMRALHALAERNVHALRGELLPLLQESDGRVLDRLAPACEADDRLQALTEEAEPLCQEQSVPEPAREPVPGGTGSNLSACLTAEGHAGQETSAPGTAREPAPGAVGADLSACQTTWRPAPPTEPLLLESSPGSAGLPAEGERCEEIQSDIHGVLLTHVSRAGPF